MDRMMRIACERIRGSLSLLFWGGALAMTIGSLLLLMTWKSYNFFFKDDYLSFPGWIAVSAAFFLFVTGILGLCMIVKDRPCRQGTFMFLIVVLLCLEVTSAVLTVVYTNRVEYELGTFDEKFNHYNGTNSNSDSIAVDAIQNELGCCGVYNYTDWRSTSWYIHTGNDSVPVSCCNKICSNCTGDLSHSEFLHQKGCQTKLKHKVKLFLVYIFWSSITVICLLILAAVSNGILMNYRTHEYGILDYGTYA